MKQDLNMFDISFLLLPSPSLTHTSVALKEGGGREEELGQKCSNPVRKRIKSFMNTKDDDRV